MNKYITIGIVMVVIIVGGVAYKKFARPKDVTPVLTGQTKQFTITSQKDKWNFIPEMIEVNRGDKVVLTVVNQDNYDHGIAIDAYGVSQRMPANSTITIEFVATQAGEFAYYCSVPCGDGTVDGHKRTHFDMVGKILVKA
jgi:cytochrome c oxidase subunit II